MCGMNIRPNNPIGFDRLISLKAKWRPLDCSSEPGVLSGSLNFSHQVIGRSEDAPIKFRLELTGAEMLVRCPADSLVLEESVLQPSVRDRESSKTNVNNEGVEIGTGGGKYGAQQGTTTQQKVSEGTPFIATTHDSAGNPIFEFKSELNASLYGPVWNEVKTFAKLKSLKIPKPYDPEPVLFVRAYSDDLKIIQPIIKNEKADWGGRKVAISDW